VAVGLAVVIYEPSFAAESAELPPEPRVLARLARFVPSVQEVYPALEGVFLHKLAGRMGNDHGFQTPFTGSPSTLDFGAFWCNMATEKKRFTVTLDGSEHERQKALATRSDPALTSVCRQLRNRAASG